MADSSRNTGRIGRETELRAWLWLVRHGYEVFDNVFPVGLIDVVAVDPKDGTVLKIEVRNGKVSPTKGNLNYPALSPRQIALGVHALVWNPVIADFVLIPPGEAKVQQTAGLSMEETRMKWAAAAERRRARRRAWNASRKGA